MENTREEKTYKNKPKTIKKMVIATYISIITLNLNGLNAPNTGEPAFTPMPRKMASRTQIGRAHV